MTPYQNSPEWLAFCRAINANPDDDLTYLTAADWVQEHGDDDRAEFIRVQCELAAWEREVVTDELDVWVLAKAKRERRWWRPEVEALWRRERELLTATPFGTFNACRWLNDWSVSGVLFVDQQVEYVPSNTPEGPRVLVTWKKGFPCIVEATLDKLVEECPTCRGQSTCNNPLTVRTPQGDVTTQIEIKCWGCNGRGYRGVLSGFGPESLCVRYVHVVNKDSYGPLTRASDDSSHYVWGCDCLTPCGDEYVITPYVFNYLTKGEIYARSLEGAARNRLYASERDAHDDLSNAILTLVKRPYLAAQTHMP